MEVVDHGGGRPWRWWTVEVVDHEGVVYLQQLRRWRWWTVEVVDRRGGGPWRWWWTMKVVDHGGGRLTTAQKM